MADLTGKKIQNTYKRLIQLSGAGQQELSASAGTSIALTDGAGNSSPLSLSQSRMGLNTLTPADILHVYSGSGSVGIRIDSQLPYINLIDNNSPTSGAGNFRISTDGTEDSNVGAFIVEDINAALSSQGKPLIIQTGADTNSLYIQADNKVGIGTSTPAKDLDVAGDIGLTGDIYVAEAKKIYFDSTDTKIYADATGDEKLYIEADSDIVLVPDVKLDIDSAIIDTATQTVTVEINQAADSFTFDGASDNILSIDGTNNRVGIGTNAPACDLHIGGSNPQIRIGDDGAEDTSLCFMGNAQDFYIALDDTTDDLTFGIGTTIGSSVKMVLENGGNVGIGTTSPGVKFEVLESTGADCVSRIVGGSGNHGSLEIWSNAGASADDGWRMVSNNGGELEFGESSASMASPSWNTRMILDVGGNLGIGTSGPTARLHVGGTDPKVVIGASTPDIWYTASYDTALLQMGNMVYSASDNQTAGSWGAITNNAYYDTGGDWNYTLADEACLYQQINGTHKFQVAPAGSADGTITSAWIEGLFIKEDGNVGIGTAAPVNDLHIKGAGTTALTTSLITLEDTSATNGNFCGTIYATRPNNAGKTFIGVERKASYGRNDIVFACDNATDDSPVASSDEVMRITSAGDVSIGGIAAPEGKLHVETAGTGATAHADADEFVIKGGSSTGMSIIGASGSYGSIYFGDNAASNDAIIQYQHTLGDLQFWTRSTHRATLDEVGNFGIGTTVFQDGVSCLGLINGTAPGGAVTDTAGLYANGGDLYGFDDSGTALRLAPAVSDERIKDNIVVIPNALSRLANVKGVTFNYTSFKDSSLPFKNKIQDSQEFSPYKIWGDDIRVGVIAQDVEKAYDGLDITNSVRDKMLTEEDASENPEKYGEIKQVEIDSLIPLLIEAVKELSAEVELLKQQ